MRRFSRTASSFSRARSLGSKAITSAALALLSAHSAAAGDEDPEARKHYQLGILAYGRGAYKDSLAELTVARELSHSYTILLNIGQVRAAMGDLVGAVEAYRQYLAEGGTHLSSAQRRSAESEITAFQARVASPVIDSDVAFSDVFVDSVHAGQTPLTLRVNPGNHDLRVSHKDYPEQQRRVTLAEGSHERVSFVLAPTKPPAASPPAASPPAANQPSATDGAAAPPPRVDLPPSPDTPAKQSPDTGRIIAWSAVGTLAAGAAVTGILALQSNHSLAELRNAAQPRDHSAMDSQSTKTRLFATVTDGLLLGAVGLGVWLTLDPHVFSSAKAASAPVLRLRAGLSEVSLRAEF